MTIELVVFDLLGTTVVDDENVVGSCLRAALLAADVGVTGAEIRAVAGLGPRDAIRLLVAHNRLEPGGFTDDDIDRLHRIFTERLLDRLDRSEVREQLGTTPALRRLQQMGVRVAIETELDRAAASHVLARTGWLARDLVDTVVARDEVRRGRPFADGILLAMDRLDVTDAFAIAKVGDTVADVEQGFAARCEVVVGIAEEKEHDDRLRAHRCPYVLPTVALVPELLARLGATPQLAAGRR